MTLDGFDKFDRALAKLPNKVGKSVVRKATRSAVKPVLKAIKDNAHGMIGGRMGALIAKHAKIIVFKHQRRGSYGLQVGMKAGVPEFDYYPIGARSSLDNKKTSGKKSYIPSAIEFGHGNARPIPYIRNAWDKTKSRAVKILGIELKNGIEKAMKTN
jgi:hypothetical protein